eukprot:TRINITY_DN615_c0_g1_i9.p1 TRINITY_DN615_c0_g1~~TRINITY_DN615_c0_g1_i9.p1  ORF type:complete len:345 (+),score=76.74 TRINITY_DN615_c0_g1_i9:135-1169(+)
MIRRPPRSTLSSSSAASDVYKRQVSGSVKEKLHYGLLKFGNNETNINTHLSAARRSMMASAPFEQFMKERVNKPLEAPETEHLFNDGNTANLHAANLASRRGDQTEGEIEEDAEELEGQGLCDGEAWCSYSDVASSIRRSKSQLEADLDTPDFRNTLEKGSGKVVTPTQAGEVRGKLLRPLEKALDMCDDCNHYGKASLSFVVIAMALGLASIGLLLWRPEPAGLSNPGLYEGCLALTALCSLLGWALWFGCYTGIRDFDHSVNTFLEETNDFFGLGIQKGLGISFANTIQVSSRVGSGFWCVIAVTIVSLGALAAQLAFRRDRDRTEALGYKSMSMPLTDDPA